MKRNRLPLLLLCLLLVLPGCAGQKCEPVRALQCTQPTALSTIRSVGGGDIAICWADYENERTTVQLVDVAKDTVNKEITLEGVWDLKEQSFADGPVLPGHQHLEIPHRLPGGDRHDGR